jgi:hypothetical protein
MTKLTMNIVNAEDKIIKARNRAEDKELDEAVHYYEAGLEIIADIIAELLERCEYPGEGVDKMVCDAVLGRIKGTTDGTN